MKLRFCPVHSAGLPQFHKANRTRGRLMSDSHIFPHKSTKLEGADPWPASFSYRLSVADYGVSHIKCRVHPSSLVYC